MTITFDQTDRALIIAKLIDYGISASDRRVEEVLSNVEAALLQQFDAEAEYAINEFEADH
jgi:hypothetical protein